VKQHQRVKPKKKKSTLNSKTQHETYELNIQIDQPNASSFNVTGLRQDTAVQWSGQHIGTLSSSITYDEDNLDDCLAEMEKSVLDTNLPNACPDILSNDNTSQGDKGDKCVLWRGPPTPTHRTSLHAAKIGKDNYDFPLPHLQVELARHKHMEDLSKFLLSKCKHLRMPSFERWVVDSKLEEMTKRLMIQEQNEVRASRNSLVNQKEDGWKRRMKRKRHQIESSLEKHLTSSGLRPLVHYDPVIPSMADVEDDASKRLILELEYISETNGKNDLDAKQICEELCEQSCQAAKQLQNLEQRLGSVSASHYDTKGNGRIHLEVEKHIHDTRLDLKHDETSTSPTLFFSLVFTRKPKKDGKKVKPFVIKINSLHYEKLRQMFHSIHDRITSSRALHVPSPMTLGTNRLGYSAATHIFHHLVFCLELRYASLAGGQQLNDLRGGGMQGAIHSQVFDCLSKYNTGGYQDLMECFASPLNVYNCSYFSLFHGDLDWHFGSCGDFFTVPIGYFRSGGAHEANPPFSPGLMQKMIERMEEHLLFADSFKDKDPQSNLSFIIVVPTCRSVAGTEKNIVQDFALKSFQAIVKSRYLSKHFILKSREHGYIEGSQHLRPTRYKESQYDTSVIILQSTAAREKEKINPKYTSNGFEDGLRLAFASRHRLELDERRQGATTPIGDEVQAQALPRASIFKNELKHHGANKSKKKRKTQ